MRLRTILSTVLSAGCGLTRLELAPHAPDELQVQGDVPDSVIARFAHSALGKVDGKRLSLSYPSEHSRLPAELASMRFVWCSEGAERPPETGPMQVPMGDAPQEPKRTFYELCLDAGAYTLCAYTDGCRLDVAPESWQRVLAARASDQLVVQLRSLADDEPIYAAPERLFPVVPSGIVSTLYYVDATRGLLTGARALGDAAADAPSFPVDPASAACSAISRDGKLFAVASAPDQLQLLSLPDLTVHWSVPAPLEGSGPGALAFDPTARRLAYARAGSLVLLDVDTGAPLSAPDGTSAARISHPAWSPDGRFLAVTLWPDNAPADEEALEGTSLARIPVAIDGSLGTPELLHASTKRDETLAFPSYSPDAAWLAYLQLKGKLRDAKDAEVRLVPAAGGAPIALKRATEGKPKPEFGPPLSAPSWLEGTHEAPWLVFNMRRGFSDPPEPERKQQLWITPVDIFALQAGEDPSAPALWLPFQAESGDHVAPRASTER